MKAPVPKNEAQRLRALRQYQILDTPPEQQLDDITLLAAHICNAPTALITFVDANRQWFKSKVGWGLPETSRDISFCAHAILEPGKELVVADAARDRRFAENPLVAGDPPHIRFYAGVPLVTPGGHALGTLCVIDRKPRKLQPEQLAALRALRRCIVTELELRRSEAELRQNDELKRFREAIDISGDAVFLIDRARMRYIDVNQTACDLSGYTRQELLAMGPVDLSGISREALERDYDAIIADQNSEADGTEGQVHRKNGLPVPVETRLRTLRTTEGWIIVAIARDITDRKRAEQVERRAKEELRQLIDNLLSFVGVLTPEGILIEANQTALRAAGLRPEEALGKPVEDTYWVAYSAESRARMQQAVRRAAAGETVRYDMELRIAEGRMVTIDFSLMPVRDRSGHVTRLIASGVDVTERDRAASALRKSEAGLRQAQRLAKLAYAVTNSDSSIESPSETLATLIGVEPARVPKSVREWLTLLHPDDRALFRDKAIEAGKTGMRWDIEYRLRRGDGAWVNFRHTIEPLQGEADAAGSAARWFNMVQDITERKRAEDALRESEENFRQLAENISEVFWLTDPAKNTMLYVSSAYEGIWGRTRDSLYASPREWLDAIHPEDRERVLAAAHAKQVAGTYDEEYRVTRPDGTLRWIRDRAFPVRDASGTVFRIAGIAEDITARKRAHALEYGQNAVLKMIAERAPLGKTLESLVRLIEEQADGMLGSILLLDANGKHVRHGAAPSLPESFTKAIDGEPIGENAGSCGTAAYRREQVIVEDIANDPRWGKYRESALAHGLLACWSTPIFDAQRRVLGTFALYFRTVRAPSAEHLRLIDLATDTAAIAIARQREEQALRESEARFRAVAESSPDAVLIHCEGRIAFVNQAMVQLLGARDAGELLGREATFVLAPEFEESARQRIAALYAGHPQPRAEQTYRRMDGTTVEVEVAAAPLVLDGRPAAQVTVRDIDERKRAEKRIEYLATHDGLTDLPNRRLIHDRISQAISHARRGGRPFALLYVDLDRFKVINDGFGHAFGDALLKAAALRLAGLVREGDTVARQSGDEFLVLLADLRRTADTYIVAQKVNEAFEKPFVLDGREVYLTASIGVSLHPQDGQDADTLIGNADVAMYRAKDLGRSTYQFFTREMSEETQRRVELETRLRTSIANGELALAYQPKVDLASGRITGCEALLRWNHPQLGAVSPARFIPVAEETGLIVPIGDWVLRTACAQNKEWLDAGLPPIVVSVNLSARQFLQQDVVAWVLGTVESTGLAPSQIELELTESLIAQDTEKVIATVNQLKAAGVKLSIDDFGTGYSSLSYLKRFRVDTLKIDQSFVRNMLTEPDDAAIALAVISLAHSLRLTVVAEGVETAEHCAFLRRNGCDEIQGYYLASRCPPPRWKPC